LLPESIAPITMTSTTVAELKPLEPEPVPVPYYSYRRAKADITTDGNQQQSEGHMENSNEDNPPTQCGTCKSTDEEELKKYECAVCFEFMDTPVGCGSCQVRFCRPCLERVAKQGGSSPRCSHCRAIFTLEFIQVDDTLQKEIMNTTVLCPFRGCGEKIAINALKLHEAQCDHIMMRCKYYDWGCMEICKKKDLEHHDNRECEFRNELGRLVHAIRKNARVQNPTLNRAVNSTTRRTNIIIGRNSGSVFDVLAMSYEAVCFTGRFAATIDVWQNMVFEDHPRSMALNVLLTLPLITLMSKCTFWMFFDLSNTSPEALYEIGFIRFCMHFSHSILVTDLAAIAIFCMIVDKEDASQWTQTALPGTAYNIFPASYPFSRDIVATCFLGACFFFVEYWETHPGIMLLFMTFSFTVSFASCMARILEIVRGLEEGVLKKARMWSTIVFALRYSSLFHMCMPSEAVKGIIILRVAKHILKDLLTLNFTVEETECFIASVSPNLFASLAGAVMSFDYLGITNEHVDWSMTLYGWYSSAAKLLFLNFFTHVAYRCGREFGDVLYFEGASMRNLINERVQSYNHLPSHRPTVYGNFVFTLTVFYMIFIMCV
jgi:hypothetical protein